jgi:hypothetical protein
MAELARDYHNNLQTQGLETGEELARATEQALENIYQTTDEKDNISLSTPLSETEVTLALRSLPN